MAHARQVLASPRDVGVINAEVALDPSEKDCFLGGDEEEPPSKSILTPWRIMQAAKTLLLIAGYLAIGPTLIILNKHILKDLDGGKGFNYPMFLSGLGLLTSSLSAHLLVRVFRVVDLQHYHKITWDFYLRNILPVGGSQAATLALGNAVYLYLTVAFIQMLKAFTPVMVLIVGVLFQVESTDGRLVGAVLGICLGTAIASAGEINFSVLGITIMLLAELTEAIRLVLTQYLLKNLKFGIIEGQYYLAPAGAACLFGASVILEFPTMVNKNAFAQIAAHPLLFLLAGTLGLGVQFMTFLVVQVTNGVTLKVIGTARNAFLVVASVYLFHEVVTPLQLFGYMVALGFFGFYSYLKASL